MELVRPARASRREASEQIAWTPAPPHEPQNGQGELLEALQSIAARLDTLEHVLLDHARDGGSSELVHRLDELPRVIGREVRAALSAPSERRLPSTDQAAG